MNFVKLALENGGSIHPLILLNGDLEMLPVTNPKVIDSFLFFNEIDILKLRLEYLKDVVDYFIVCECNYTYSGKSKPYYLDQVIDVLDEDVKNKIISLHYEPDISNFVFKEIDFYDANSHNWCIERGHRNYINEKLKYFSPDDLFMLSDVDEIPRKEVIKEIISNRYYLNDDFVLTAKSDMFYYNFSTLSNDAWTGTIFTKVKIAIQNECQHLREKRHEFNSIDNGGWHFSYFGGIDRIRKKIESFSHQELNKKKYTSIENIIDCIKNKKDVFQRAHNFNDYDFSNFPENLKSIIIKIFSKNFYEIG